MKVEDLTFEGYIRSPLDVALPIDILSPVIGKKFLRLTRKISSVYFIKKIYIKSLIKQLVLEQKLREFTFLVKRDLKPSAYMHDDGYLYLSYGIFLHCSPLPFLSVFVHELSHIWLSQQPFYPRLKSLNKEFKERCKGKSLDLRADLLSPIELYARLVSLQILEGLTRAAKKERTRQALAVQIEDLKEKIDLIRDALKNFVENHYESIDKDK